MNYHKIWIFSLLASSLLCSGCASIASFLFGKPEDVPAMTSQAGEALPLETASRYEWAIQHYESGHYEDSLQALKDYENSDATLRGFPLVPYYQGMSYYQLQKCDQARTYLEKFLSASSNIPQSQEARIALMACLQRKREWKALGLLAAESDNYPMYAENRVRARLFWTEALARQKERSGAKRLLTEAAQMVDNLLRNPADLEESAVTNKQFQAELFRLQLLLQLEDCQTLAYPQNPKPEQKQILVERWVETKGECLLTTSRRALDSGSEFTGPQIQDWVDSLSEYYEGYGNSPATLAKAKLYPTEGDALMAIKPKLRGALYRIAALVENKLKVKDSPPDGRKALESLQKTIEDLLLKLSVPS